MESWLQGLEKADDDADIMPLKVLQRLGLRQGATEWFERQTTDTDLAQRRGVDPREPLPGEFGLFSDDGRLLTTQRRTSVEALRHWLDDAEGVVDWTFRHTTIDAAYRKRCVQQVEQLNDQSWGPKAYLDAVLKDWPETEEYDVSPKAGEAALVKALDSVGA